MLECGGWSMAKGLYKSIKQFKHIRADKKLGRTFVDLREPKVVESLGRKRDTLIEHEHLLTVYKGCTLCATSRTPRSCSSNSLRILVQTMHFLRWYSSDLMRVVNSAGGKLGTCVDHEESSRNSLRPTVLNLIEQQSTR